MAETAVSATPGTPRAAPTRAAAVARIAQIRPADYARTRNHLDGAVTGLSPYLTHGLVTLREVLTSLLERERLDVQHKLLFEFGWREFFRHGWAQHGDGILHSLHPGPCPESAYARTLPRDIREAGTGIPAIDAAVRTLYATGTLHNHARLWLASYVVHLRRVHWRAGADWLLAHLLDGDLGSNHLSWQWVAGTGSHKAYLFNAENVARHAPAAWHSPGTPIDASYEALETLARGRRPALTGGTSLPGTATLEPACLTAPPAALAVTSPGSESAERLRGRQVWLVHPWALRRPPADLADDAVVIGVYLRETHAAWPWPEARWRWVDAAMADVTAERWFTDAAGLALALAGAASVRSVDDPHATPWLRPVARLDPAPTLFPPVARRCASFSRWWAETTRDLTWAEELL